VIGLRAILQLTRLDSSLLGFFVIFIPVLRRTHDLGVSFGKAIPLLFICMCTFIANSLDDIERDQVNHPTRPLPSRQLTPTFAALLYFVCLGAALFSTRSYIAPDTAFWYYGLIILSISYSYIIEYFPAVKAPYVAALISATILTVAASYPNEKRLYILAAAVFLIACGREICMDIPDRAGDSKSVMHWFDPLPLAVVGFAFQTSALLLLASQARRPADIADIAVMALFLVLAAIYWFKMARYRYAIYLMKGQFIVGLYFLW
jgi:cytochrome bd-type quinol oxidase subunit 2